MGSFEENLTRKIDTRSIMCVCKYLKQRVKKIGEQNGKSFKGFTKTKKKKTHIKKLSFVTPFKIEFLLPCTGCRKVLGKMPVSRLFYVVVREIQW